MNLNERLKYHFLSFPEKDLFKDVSIMVLTKNGQVLSLLGKEMKREEAQSLGALMVGMWQASEAVAEMIGTGENNDTGLSYQNSESGFFLLQPTEINPEVFWSFIFEKQLNPGKIKNYSKHLRRHFDEMKILEESSRGSQTEEGFLFENVTAEEVDNLFSFAGI